MRDLIERRVPHYTALYLGAGWGLVEFLSFMEERFSMSPAWTNMTLVLIGLLIPSVVLFAYNHGRPGKDNWTRTERLGIPLNVVLAAIVLTTAFSGRDLRATTTTVAVTDEEGNVVERKVPRSSYRKRVAVFYFDAETPGDTAAAWLREAAPTALSLDLTQDLFVDVRTPGNFIDKLREAGYPSGHDVPLTAKLKIAEQLHLPYVITGTVAQGVEGKTVRVTVYETATGQAVRERVSTSGDLMSLIDDLTGQVKQDLGLPTARPDGMRDAAVAELLSRDEGAVRAAVEGISAATQSDWPRAQRSFARAVERDSTFALAHYSLYQALVVSGNAEVAMGSLQAALRHHQYRLPERLQFLVKAEHYFMRQEVDNAAKVADMMVKLYPDDLQGHAMQAQLAYYRGEYEKTIEAFRRVVELDPQQHEIMLQIGQLHEQLGQFAEAEAVYRQYAEQFSNDPDSFLPLAGVQRTLGRLDDARESLDRALLIDPTHVAATVDLAALHRNVGEYDRAWDRLQEARTMAGTPQERLTVANALKAFHDYRGEYGLSLQALQSMLEVLPQMQPPMAVLMSRLRGLGAWVKGGRTAEALRLLEESRTQISAPLDNHWKIGQLELGRELRDTVRLQDGIAGVESIIAAFNLELLRAELTHSQALLQELRGDWQGALDGYRRAVELQPEGLALQRDIARSLRHLGRLDEAGAAIAEHLRVVPTAPESNLEAARIALARGDSAAARAHLDISLKAWENADASYAAPRQARELLNGLKPD